MMKRSLLLPILTATLLLQSCASGPELEKYSRREIDRPYTLPKGVATWHVPGAIGFETDSAGNTSHTGLAIVPLFWEQSLSDDWNLLWFPLPLGVSHQIMNTADRRLGLTFGFTRLAFGSLTGVRVDPTLTLAHREKLTQNLALEITPSFSASIPFKSGEPTLWNARLMVGPLFQLTDTLELKPNLAVIAAKQVTIDFMNSGAAYLATTPLSFSTGFSGVWSFSRQWDLRPSYTFSGMGSDDHSRVHFVTLDFVHFW